MNYSKETSAWLSALQSAVERVAESPKTTVTAATFSASAGVATASQWLTGASGWIAVISGVVATAILGRLNWLKGEQAKLEMEHQKLQNEILRKKAEKLGIDITEAEEGEEKE